jgi:hypothetical protein
LTATALAVRRLPGRMQEKRGVAQPGLARLLGVQEVRSSNLLAPIFSAAGRKNRAGEGRK